MTAYEVPDGPKMLRETLCVAQWLIARGLDPRRVEHSDRLQRLIDECDRHRPLGPDGKHGDRHTPTCGCEGCPIHGRIPRDGCCGAPPQGSQCGAAGPDGLSCGRPANHDVWDDACGGKHGAHDQTGERLVRW